MPAAAQSIAPSELGPLLSTERTFVQDLNDPETDVRIALERVRRSPHLAGRHTARCIASRVKLLAEQIPGMEGTLSSNPALANAVQVSVDAVSLLSILNAGKAELSRLAAHPAAVALHAATLLKPLALAAKQDDRDGLLILMENPNFPAELLPEAYASLLPIDTSGPIGPEDLEAVKRGLLLIPGSSPLGPETLDRASSIAAANCDQELASSLIAREADGIAATERLLLYCSSQEALPLLELLGLNCPRVVDRRAAFSKCVLVGSDEARQVAEDLASIFLVSDPGFFTEDLSKKLLFFYAEGATVSDLRFEHLRSLVAKGMLEPTLAMQRLIEIRQSDQGRRLAALVEAAPEGPQRDWANKVIIANHAVFTLSSVQALLAPESSLSLRPDVKAALTSVIERLGLQEKVPLAEVTSVLRDQAKSADPLVASAATSALNTFSWNPFKRWKALLRALDELIAAARGPGGKR